MSAMPRAWRCAEPKPAADGELELAAEWTVGDDQ